MQELEDPYVVKYRQIHAIASEVGMVELLERSTCYGGSAWAKFHYSKSPLVVSSRAVGDWFRYIVRSGTAELDLASSMRSAGIESLLVKGEFVEITYAGLGGGGVGATKSRSGADDVIAFSETQSGGGRIARGTITIPRRERLVIGVDDTDNKTEGATWTLVHNIASMVDRKEARYVSHSLVQLFPVPTKTQNCVSTAVEFAVLPGKDQEMIRDFRDLLERYSVSPNTGMAVFRGFDPSSLMPYAQRVRSERILYEDAVDQASKAGVEVLLDGRGLIGALAAIPYYSNSEISVVPSWERSCGI